MNLEEPETTLPFRISKWVDGAVFLADAHRAGEGRAAASPAAHGKWAAAVRRQSRVTVNQGSFIERTFGRAISGKADM